MVRSCLFQTLVYGVMSVHIWPRWEPLAWVLIVAAILQALVAVASTWFHRPRMTLWLTASSLACILVGLGMFVHAAQHLIRRFGEQAATTGTQALWSILVVLPWIVFVPIWQLWTQRVSASSTRERRWLGLFLVWSFVLPPLLGTFRDRPLEHWPSQPDLESAATAAWLRWTGEAPNAPIPKGEGPVQLLMTPWNDGQSGRTVRGEGNTLQEAVESALPQLIDSPGERAALVLDIARERWSSGFMPVGEGGVLANDGGVSPSVGWRPDGVRWERIYLDWSVPVLRPSEIGGASRTRFDSVLVDDEGVRNLSAGWTEPAVLTATSARNAALAGAHMLARNQDSRGRYTYLVQGPSGTAGTGYNFPRHAGTTWFLARMAAQVDDEEVSLAASRGLRWMTDRTIWLNDEMACFADATRRDGLIWVGTTALAVLAAVELDDQIALPWGRFLAASIDARGQVRGEAERETGRFQEQRQNPYGQGQTLLALASLVRAGHNEFRPALERGAAYLDGGYAPLGAGRLVTIDEHWACLAALAINEVLDAPAGIEICEAYLRDHSITPVPSDGIRANVAAAGGVAEAVVALAKIENSEMWRTRALAYGDLFMEAQYRSEDAPFLEKPEALVGGFRSSPYQLDVQIDTVQHVGSALLGIAALIDGDWRAGSAP